jgi:hypothetical protein
MTTTKQAQIPWIKYSGQVDRQLAAHGVTDEKIDALVRSLEGQEDSAALRRYRTTTTSVVEERQLVRSSGFGSSTRAVNGASDKQKALIDKLLTERVHSYTEEDVVEAKADWRLTRKMIDFLLAPSTPRVQRTPAPVVVETPAEPARNRLDFSVILDGNYAVRADGVVKFYRISTGRNGFKRVQIRASEELHPVHWKAGIAIMHQIVEAGLAESRMLFVTELERCCKCGRSLTEEESRINARVNGGYGPDCANK